MADQANFERDVMPLAPQLYAHALRLTRRPVDAEDVLQESFLKAYRAFDSYEDGTNLRAWMYRIVTNTFINRYRKDQRRPNEIELDDVGDMYLYRRLQSLPAPGSSASAEETALDTLIDERVRDAIESLPEAFRLPVLLADAEGFAYKEIAEILDVPIGTVMSRLHRGRKALQKELYDLAVERGIVEASHE